VTGLTGNLRYARGSGSAGSESFRVMPQTRPRIRATNPRPAVPTVAGDLRIAALNVLNYFSVVDTGSPRCGPRGRDGCRGADSEEERRRQLAKIAATLAALDADVVALVELENDARDSLADIAAAANRDLKRRSPQAPQYDFVATGTFGGDAIKTGLLYRPATVTPDGPHALLDARVDPRFDDRRHRPVLAQAFVHRQSAERLTVAVTHLKSKGTACDDDGDRNSGDGQGNCNGARTLAAEALVDWLARDPTGSGDPDVLLIGDFNAYVNEDPMRVFARDGWANLGTRAAGLYYTYVYDARAGALDHALASPALAPKIAGFAVWHSNADEAALHDYNLEHGRDPAIFDAAAPWRASDHDPLLVGIGAGAD
ncbi:MAG TPA: ExeM/NucH family extracellular endonuclease, partial [Woeseiaceae bacterium]|nr:ExeM/NucH family extracellular endonuclease [Woeseiaceae bacterium]